ncbi:MFS transporter [Sanguibacter antarcticus]|uniref:DHA2 family multidrug resistance protein-like MFS transporter n=1 Tax=Sanguibacter antarcticus TaxID=372484 RepID=A0A2A9E7Z1_9MICO|nr:MFS transporter [Sanguibacter antarcticus]PFG34953.1 DHA2 family multidrug resistance protein-like MFS transporter [Sanguibacter antarcticus]
MTDDLYRDTTTRPGRGGVTTAPTAPPAALAPPRAGRRAWLGLVALMLPVLLVSIDNTVLSFAIPQLSVALSPSAAQMLWIVDIYPLVLAGLLVTMGTLGDRVGRRWLLLVGATGFGIVSVLASFATDASHLILARALLGLFGATLMPSTLALLRNLFLDGNQRRLAIAVWASGFSAGTALGPIVGGWLLEHFWWGSIFLINVPVLLVLLVAAPVLLPESRNPRAVRLDALSVGLSVVAMLPFVLGIKRLASEGADTLGVVSLAVGIVLGVVFVRRQMRLKDPLLDVGLFRSRTFSASVLANFMAVFSLAGLVFFVSQYLQLVLEISPLDAGAYLLPGAVASVLMGLLAVALARVAPIWLLVPAGLLLASAGYVVGTTLSGTSSVGVIVVVFVLVGSGAGLAETLTNDAILSSVPPERAGAASGISETAYELGASLGVAVLGSVLAAVYRTSLVLPAGLDPALVEQSRATLGGAVDAASSLPSAEGEVLVEAARAAFADGVDVTSTIGAVLAFFTAVGVGLALWSAQRADHRRAALQPETDQSVVSS